MRALLLTVALLGCRVAVPEVPAGPDCPAPEAPDAAADAGLREAFDASPWTLEAQLAGFVFSPPVPLDTWTVEILGAPRLQRVHRLEGTACVAEDLGWAPAQVVGGEGQLVLERGWVELRWTADGPRLRGHATAQTWEDDAIEAWWRQSAFLLDKKPGPISPARELFFTEQHAALHMAHGFPWFEPDLIAEGPATLQLQGP